MKLVAWWGAPEAEFGPLGRGPPGSGGKVDLIVKSVVIELLCLVVFNSIVDGLSFLTYQMDGNDNIFQAWEQLGIWGMAKPMLSLRPPANVTT